MESYYEDSVLSRDFNYANISKGLSVVRNYIIKNQLVLYGGMAINASLKLKNEEGIYHENKLPDYDFYSPDSLKDASNIGHILCKMGLPNVSIINSIHTSTRRVRVDGVAVADIGYCPKAIYDKLPVVIYEGIRFVHPHFQIMDIHRSLSYPFESPMRAVIFHRWRKDMKRYMKLIEAYPICKDKYKIPMREVKLDKKLLRDCCLTGFAALSFIESGGKSIQLPRDEPIQLLSDNFSEFENESSKYYENVFSRMNRFIVSQIDNETYEIVDNNGDQVGCEIINGVRIANPQHIMLSILVRQYLDTRTSDAVRVYCCCAYNRATELVAKYPPTINVYGYASLHDTYYINRLKEASRVAGINLKNPEVPTNLYLDSHDCDSVVKFNYSQSQYFAISGQETTRFIAKNIVKFGQTDMISDAYEALKLQSIVIKK